MAAQVQNQQNRSKDYPTRIVSVVFGNPRSPECAGYGLCKLDEDGDMPPPKPPKQAVFTGCPRHKATVTKVVTTDGKIHLLFGFDKSSLSEDILTKYFGTKQFVIASNALHLPASLTAAFDMNPAVLVEGLYPITETKTHFHIPIQTT
jgi:hypothetical protein